MLDINKSIIKIANWKLSKIFLNCFQSRILVFESLIYHRFFWRDSSNLFSQRVSATVNKSDGWGAAVQQSALRRTAKRAGRDDAVPRPGNSLLLIWWWSFSEMVCGYSLRRVFFGISCFRGMFKTTEPLVFDELECGQGPESPHIVRRPQRICLAVRRHGRLLCRPSAEYLLRKKGRKRRMPAPEHVCPCTHTAQAVAKIQKPKVLVVLWSWFCPHFQERFFEWSYFSSIRRTRNRFELCQIFLQTTCAPGGGGLILCDSGALCWFAYKWLWIFEPSSLCGRSIGSICDIFFLQTTQSFWDAAFVSTFRL